ncbi:nitroreductase family protein [bacterium]|nr:nitroreductase family protein [bacterium]
MIEKSDILRYRTPEHDVSLIFPQRWSSRALSGEPIGEEELMTLLEAARWAPSSYNNQSWRFLYARRETPAWETFYGLLSDYNRKWAGNAAVLIVVISKNTFDFNGKPSRTHSYDTGAAWMSLALQGSINGLVVHGMQGFDYDRAKEKLRIPDGYTVEAMAAVGRPGRNEDLPEDIRKGEAPNSRKKIEEFAFEGGFPE